MSKTYHELVRQKANLEEALKNIRLALESETYTRPFKHEVKNQLKACEFNHQTMKAIIGECENRKMGIDPDLILQLTEEEVHRQFTEMVKEHIKARPIERLFELKHELELFMLNERNTMYTKGLAKCTAELEAIETALNADAHEQLPVEVVVETPYVATMEEKLEAVQTLASEGVLTNKEIKKVLKVPAKKKVATKKK